MISLIRLRMQRFFRSALAVLMTAALEHHLPKLQAEEGGAGDYVPGLYASLLNITPNKPGFAAWKRLPFLRRKHQRNAAICRLIGCEH